MALSINLNELTTLFTLQLKPMTVQESALEFYNSFLLNYQFLKTNLQSNSSGSVCPFFNNDLLLLLNYAAYM